MNTAQRAALIARAKSLATPVVSCVAASIRPSHLLAGASRDELMALVVVLAEAADHGRLREVTEAPGDTGMPPPDRRDVLRRAHAEYQRLLRGGQPVPRRVRVLESEYRQSNKRRRESAASEAADAA